MIVFAGGVVLASHRTGHEEASEGYKYPEERDIPMHTVYVVGQDARNGDVGEPDGVRCDISPQQPGLACIAVEIGESRRQAESRTKAGREWPSSMREQNRCS
jgi:hypothetical protein